MSDQLRKLVIERLFLKGVILVKAVKVTEIAGVTVESNIGFALPEASPASLVSSLHHAQSVDFPEIPPAMTSHLSFAQPESPPAMYSD
ncbi:hypothetical protein [Burkholderia stabilis]|uniref:hypothetical protein n=1 Tax=Burkholderia stabilis TaxID=95485 RepID=UPI0011469313|nr:hypothetical protein [Burkholderia stabilis]